MTVQQDDPRSWLPSGAGPESATSMLSELSQRRPRTASPAAPRTRPAEPLTAVPTQDPTAPGFSPDGTFWWDGHRWTPTEALERQTADDAPARSRRRRVVLVWSGLVTAILAVLFLAALPVLWDRGGGSGEALQTALLDVAEAQQLHLVDHGRFAADANSLTLYLVRVGGLPADVALDVRTADDLTYCVAGTSVDGKTLWVTASGTVSTESCG